MSAFVKPEEPQTISEADAADLQRQGVLAVDPDRTLPLWFDGRFLTARDLNRQQSYFVARHSALGRTIGSGVIEGLDVSIGEGASAQDTIRIAAGQGIAFDGAHIHLPSQMVLKLSDLAVQTALNAQLGLSVHPSAPLHSRSGLFVLSLRPVEYTANQTTSFPTTVTGQRTVQMGDRVEAVAATLTPYAPTRTTLTSLDARADAAQRIFAEGKIDGVPGHALPLAMLSMRYGVIEWVDVHLVRRDLVAARREFLGLGLAQDQLRLAHFQQYRAALADVMDHYANSNQPARFPAEQHFRLLPPAGPLPADAVDPAAMAQVFFPGEVEVELSIIPDDELPALIEESFDLPPIDLTRPVEERDSLSVMIVAPMARHTLRSQLASLQQLTKPLRPLSMLGQGPQKPLDRLGNMKISLADAGARTAPAESVAAAEWASVVNALTQFGLDGDSSRRTLWYMRRRTLRRSADLESVPVAIGNIDPVSDTDVPAPTDPVVTPAPGPAPGPTPTPSEPEPNPLSDEARAALLKLARFGDLAKITEVQLRRATAPVSEAFAKAILTTLVADDVVSVTATVARMSANAANARARLEEAIESILRSSEKGRAALSAGLIGAGRTEVSAERFEQLQFFLTEKDLLENFANALPALRTEAQTEFVLKLESMVSAGAKDEIVALTNRVVAAAEEASRPAPAPTPSPTPAPDPAAESAARREREVNMAAEKLVTALPERSDQNTLKQLLEKATLDQREAIVGSMTKARVPESRIATGAALNALATGGQLTDANIQRVRAIDSAFVEGIGVLEEGLLKTDSAPAPAPPPPPPPTPPTRGTTGGIEMIRDVDRRRIFGGTGAERVIARDERAIAGLVLGTATSQADRRVGLLARAETLGALAKFGAANARSPAKVRPVIKELVAALDEPGATVGSVDRTIKTILRGNV